MLIQFDNRPSFLEDGFRITRRQHLMQRGERNLQGHLLVIAQILESYSSFLDLQQRLAVEGRLGNDTLQLREFSTIPHLCLPELHRYLPRDQVGVVVALGNESLLGSGDGMRSSIDLTVHQGADSLHVQFELWARKQLVARSWCESDAF